MSITTLANTIYIYIYILDGDRKSRWNIILLKNMLYRERPAIAMFSYYHYCNWKNEYAQLFNVEGHNS